MIALTKALVMLDLRDTIVWIGRHPEGRGEQFASRIVAAVVTSIALPWRVVSPSDFASAASNARRHKRINSARRREPAELDQVDPPFAGFHLGDPAMGTLRRAAKVALGKSRSLPARSAVRNKGQRIRPCELICPLLPLSGLGRMLPNSVQTSDKMDFASRTPDQSPSVICV